MSRAALRPLVIGRPAPPWLMLLAVLLGPLLGSARGQNVLTRPHLGKTCSQEGANCTANFAGFVDYEVSVTSNVTGQNAARLLMLANSNLDPNNSNNWFQQCCDANFLGPTAGLSFDDMDMRLAFPSAGWDTWKPGGLVRAAVYRANLNPLFYEYLQAQFRDVANVLTPYPSQWFMAGTPFSPTFSILNSPGKAVFVLSDDSVTPADDNKQGNFLTIQGTVSNPLHDTLAYYTNTCVGIPAGSQRPGPCTQSSGSIHSDLGNMDAFRSRFAMARPGVLPAAGELVATYFNRGDLGIGREMHCKHKESTNETACYVRNFRAGGTVFGGSSADAFRFMAPPFAPTPFATVAMINRGGMGASERSKVVFMVYGPLNADSIEPLVLSAALDQHALLNQGVDGINYNKHIPGNCMHCHGAGGNYVPQSDLANRGALGAMFLPFDLDQFEYHPTKGNFSRTNQQAVFKSLNIDIVKRVADQYGAPRAGAIINTINGWYANGTSNTFLSGYVPPSWLEFPAGAWGDKHFYQKVLRPYCRTCHMTFGTDDYRSFENWFDYDMAAATAAAYVCPTPAGGATPLMPQAEQVSRQFWRSDARGILVGYSGATSSAINITECIPGPNR
jgi:hypothetical protein